MLQEVNVYDPWIFLFYLRKPRVAVHWIQRPRDTGRCMGCLWVGKSCPLVQGSTLAVHSLSWISPKTAEDLPNSLLLWCEVSTLLL